MMYLHLGKPRSGKSFDVMRSVVLPALRDGRRVLTNIEGLDDPEIIERIANYLQLDSVPEQIVFLPETAIRDHSWFRNPQNRDCIVIDECQIYWPGGTLKPTDPDAFAFMSRHGHYNIDIHLITQAHTNFNSSMRKLCGQTQVYRKMGFIGLHSKYQVQYYNGSEPEKDCYLNSEIKSYDPKIFSLYRSIVEGAGVPQAKQANILASKKFIFFAVFLVFAVAWTSYKLKHRSVLSSSPAEVSESVKSSVGGLFGHASKRALRAAYTPVFYSSLFELDGLKFLRLIDDRLVVLHTAVSAGGLIYQDSVFYLPAVVAGKSDE